MASTATWFAIVGFVLLISGFVLRTVAMMKSSDATPAESRILHGRELILQHRRLFPKSPLPLLARSLILSGTLLLVAAVGTEISR